MLWLSERRHVCGVALHALCLLLWLCVFSEPVAGGEAEETVARIERTYADLPDNATRDEFEPLTKLMLSVASVDPPDHNLFLRKYHSRPQLLEFLGKDFVFSDDFVAHEMLLTSRKRDPKLMKSKDLPTRKWIFLHSALARVAIEGSLRDGVADDQEAREQLALKFLTLPRGLMYSHYSWLSRFQELDSVYDQEMAGLEADTGVLTRAQRRVEGCLETLTINGDTMPDKIRDWCSKVREPALSDLEYCALMSWMWTSVGPEHLLRSEEFTPAVKAGGRLDAMVRHWGNPDVFGHMAFDPASGYLSAGSVGERVLIARLFTFLMEDILKCTSVFNSRSNLRNSVTELLGFEHEWLLAGSALEVSRPVISRLRKWLRTPPRRRSSFYHVLKMKEEGVGGEAWFCGGQQVSGDKQIAIESDFVYPFLFSITRSAWGPMPQPVALDNLGHFEWAPPFFGKDDPGLPAREYPIGLTVDPTLFPGKLHLILDGGWRERFLTGLAGMYDGADLDTIASQFSPCVYYRYPRTKWRIHSVTQYSEDFDWEYCEEATVYLEVTPVEGDKPVEAMVGIIHKESDNWLYRTGDAPSRSRKLWNILEFTRSRENQAIFKRTEEIVVQLGREELNVRVRDLKRLGELMEQ